MACYSTRVNASAATAVRPQPLVKGPPRTYDHRSALQQRSAQLIGQQYPSLLPLVADGTLVALERPAGYTERRSDGYQEPLLILLVGTSHVSRRSTEDVRRVTEAVQPDAVVVELCRSRQAVMYPGGQQQQQQLQQQQQQGKRGAAAPGVAGTALLSAGHIGSSDEGEDDTAGGRSGGSSGSKSWSSSGSRSTPGSLPSLWSLSGGSLLPAFQRSMELGGAPALLLRLLLGRLSAQLSGSVGLQTGGEFVAAREEAEALGAQLVLGDRPIEITLQRAWDSLSWHRRAQLAAKLAGGAVQAGRAGGGALNEAAIEALKDDDAVSMLFSQLSEAYPELVGPLIHERDLYLAWTLKRSKAVNGARRVVGVVGKGHLRGVCYALTHDEAGAHLRFRDLVGGKNVKADQKRKRAEAAGRFALETALFGAAWYAWTLLQPQCK